MKFKLFERVLLKDKDIAGRVVDIYTGDDGAPVYTVQSENPGYTNDPEAYPGEYPLFDCREERLSPLTDR